MISIVKEGVEMLRLVNMPIHLEEEKMEQYTNLSIFVRKSVFEKQMVGPLYVLQSAKKDDLHSLPLQEVLEERCFCRLLNQNQFSFLEYFAYEVKKNDMGTIQSIIQQIPEEVLKKIDAIEITLITLREVCPSAADELEREGYEYYIGLLYEKVDVQIGNKLGDYSIKKIRDLGVYLDKEGKIVRKEEKKFEFVCQLLIKDIYYTFNDYIDVLDLSDRDYVLKVEYLTREEKTKCQEYLNNNDGAMLTVYQKCN